MPAIQQQIHFSYSAERESERSLVLVVDDDPIALKLVERMLREEGLACEKASTAQEAIGFLETRRPELILSDVLMPGMDGIEFCSLLRKQPQLEGIPIIFFTGLSSGDSISRAYQAGASDYIVKPIRKVDLLSRARHHIEDFRKKQADKQRIQKLDQLNKSKTQFLGVASHDLRNPLVSIRGISQFLEKGQFGELNESQHELVRTIFEASESMLTLVEDLLDVSMFESGQMPLHPKKLSLESLVDQAIALHSITAYSKSISIVKETRSEDTTVEVDQKLVSRVIDNLLNNAVKFSPRDTKVRVILESDVNSASLKVEDEGPGIPEDQFDLLFKEFGRTSNQPTGGESSSGIGLYICKRIVQQHGGSISAENRPDKGARFIVTLNRILENE